MSDARWSLHFAWGRAPYALDLPEIVIGRGDACSLQIEDPAASDEHARFIVDDDEQVWLEDLASGTPTLINGRPIAKRILLTDGDFIQIGHAVLTLRAAVARPLIAAAPDARTVNATEVPDEVRRLVAERDAAAKNFVVGSEQPSSLPTLMMESPLAPQPVQAPASRARDAQQTVEVDAADILASIRRDAPPPMAVEPTAQSYENAAATISTAAVPSAPANQPTLQMETLQGIGPSGGHGELAAAPTLIAGSHAQSPSPRPSVTLPEMHDLAAASTMIAETPSLHRRSSTMTDLTPLPAPLPAPTSTSSIPLLEPLVRAIMSKQGRTDDPSQAPTTGEQTRAVKKPTQRSNVETQLDTPAPRLSALATQQFAAVRDPLAESIAMLPTALPTALPPEVVALQAGQSRASLQNQAVAPMPTPTAQDYTPPKKGMFGSFSRAFDFFQQMFALGKKERVLMKPIINNILIATPIMAALSVLLMFVHTARAAYGVMSLGVTVLYFVDYACNALTASLVYDYVTIGKADLASAKARVKHAAQGILIFAAVSAALDVASTYARERRDLVSKILLRILYGIWTTATYVIMPAMIIEGIPFSAAFARSKKLMDHDPTGVGAGVVALSLVTYILAAVVFSVAYTLMSIGSRIHPTLGMMLFFAMVNVYWAVSGWLKIAYSTCFYMWAQKCETQGSADSALAPLPLRHAIDAG